MSALRIQIARTTALSSRALDDRWEVRLIGPGGWRTTVSAVPLSQARSDAYALGQVLKIEPEQDA